MPTIHKRQLAMVTAQLCFILLHHHLQKRRQVAKLTRLKQRTRRNELTILLFTIITTMRPPRYGPRFWVDTRSSHWVNHVLGGSLLQDQEFSRTFRMTPGSFLELHRILGIFHSSSKLVNKQRLTSENKIPLFVMLFDLKFALFPSFYTLRKARTTETFRIK